MQNQNKANSSLLKSRSGMPVELDKNNIWTLLDWITPVLIVAAILRAL